MYTVHTHIYNNYICILNTYVCISVYNGVHVFFVYVSACMRMYIYVVHALVFI